MKKGTGGMSYPNLLGANEFSEEKKFSRKNFSEKKSGKKNIEKKK